MCRSYRAFESTIHKKTPREAGFFHVWRARKDDFGRPALRLFEAISRWSMFKFGPDKFVEPEVLIGLREHHP
jgi:hypothetical protein